MNRDTAINDLQRRLERRANHKADVAGIGRTKDLLMVAVDIDAEFTS